MGRNWKSIARHYLAGLGSLLFYLPYEIYKGAKTVYHVAKKQYNIAAYNLSATLVHTIAYPLYSFYRMFEGTYELVRGKALPWIPKMPSTTNM
jgi:hypothetical protein